MKLLTVALAGSLAFAGCKNKDSDRGGVRAQEAMAAPAPGAPATASDAKKPETTAIKHVDTRKVIRTGRIDLTVDSVDATRGKLEARVESAGGYIDSTQVEQHATSSSAVIVIRVPADAFGGLLPALHQIGEGTAETTNAADITDQFVDTEAQLASAQQLEKRLRELATAKNGTLEQILTVERELARVRGEIEGYQGHLKQWNDLVSLSTLTISMTQKTAPIAIVPPKSPPLGSKTSESFHSSIAALRDLGAWKLVNGVALLPWLLFLVPGVLAGRRLMRRYRRIPVAVATLVPPAEPAP